MNLEKLQQEAKAHNMHRKEVKDLYQQVAGAGDGLLCCAACVLRGSCRRTQLHMCRLLRPAARPRCVAGAGVASPMSCSPALQGYKLRQQLLQLRKADPDAVLPDAEWMVRSCLHCLCFSCELQLEIQMLGRRAEGCLRRLASPRLCAASHCCISTHLRAVCKPACRHFKGRCFFPAGVVGHRQYAAGHWGGAAAGRARLVCGARPAAVLVLHPNPV